MVGWGVALCGDAPSFENLLSVVVVTIFPMWLTGIPVELIAMTALMASNIGSP